MTINKRSYYERRLMRLAGMSPEKLAEIHKAQGSQIWWCQCWNCKGKVQMRRDEMEHSSCPHCGKDLWKRE